MLRLVGEPGIGKTALIEAAASLAHPRGFRVAQVTALEVESRLPGAVAGLLLRHLKEQTTFDRVPEPGEVLEALASSSVDQPLLVTVDDVQWLDGPSLRALVFATRRLLADPVAVVLAGRPEIGRIEPLAHVPCLEVPTLPDEEALALLRSVSPEIADRAGRQIVRSLGGLPLALVEATSLLPEEVLRGSQIPPSPIPVGQAVQQRYAQGFDALPALTRAGLVLLAADDSGDPSAVQRAWVSARVSVSDLEAAEEAGLITLGPEPRFVHPLARAAVHAAATPGERRSAHRLLAQLHQSRGDLSRGLRHQADASTGPDENLASALEREAERLGDQGDSVEGATVAERAATLSPARQDRLRRLVLSAELTPDAAHMEELAGRVTASTRDPVLRARALLVRLEGPHGVSPDELDTVLSDLSVAALDEDLRVRLDVNRIWTAMAAADVARLDQLGEELDAPGANARWDLVAALGMAYTFLGRHLRGVALLTKAFRLSADVEPELLAGDSLLQWAMIPGWLGKDVSDLRERMGYMARRFRASGRPALTASAAFFSAEHARRSGHWQRAESLFTEAIDLDRAMQLPSSVSEARLAATLTSYRGEVARTQELVAAAERHFRADPSEKWMAQGTDQARGALALTLGHVESAIVPLQRVASAPFLGRGCRDAVAGASADLTEALVALGLVGQARDVADRLAQRLDGIIDPHGLALVQRCFALSRPEDADDHYREAVARHEQTDDPFEAARTHLLQGEHLRRTRRVRDARESLGAALDAFERIGVPPWSERARRELGATGQRPPMVTPQPAHQLTPQELRVALAVVDGMSNAEVAASLFLSVKTVEFHLSRVYRKLGVPSRGGLARALDRSGAPG